MTALNNWPRVTSITPATTAFVVDVNPDTTPATKSILGSNVVTSLLASVTAPVLFKSANGINFDTADGGDSDIDVLTLDVTGTPKLWWDESIDAFSFTKRLFLGDTQTTNSVDPFVSVNRNVNDDVAGNGHCFSDSSVITRAGGIGYNSFDARIVVSGTADYDHFATFQSMPTLETTGTTTNNYGLFVGLDVNNGTLTNAYGTYIEALNKTAPGEITNAYGVYIEQQTDGATLNYSLYCAGATSLSRFEGKVGIIQAPQSHIILAVGTVSIAASATAYAIQVATENTGAVYSYLAGIDLQPRSSGTANHLGLFGAFVRPQHVSTGTLTNVYDVYAATLGGTGSGVVTNRYGLKVLNMVGGSLTNQYGIHIEALTKGATLNYAIYQAGSTPSVFEGPVHQKNVSGPAALTDGAVLYATDQAAGNSCIHTKTENGAVLKLFQGAAIADAGAGEAETQLNLLLAHLRAMGIIAT